MKSTDKKEVISTCSNCQSALPAAARFCPKCGKQCFKKITPKLNIQQSLIIIIVGCLTAGTVYSLQPWFQGKAPSQQFTKNHIQDNSNESKITPSNSEETFTQAEAALKKIAESETPDPAVILEAVDLLSRILSAEPENAWALLQMAELAFEQRIFDKSVDLYARYLKLTPDDSAVRTRYASALTFSGKTEQALSELEGVLVKEPDNFQALAFSAIANQQAGNKDKAQTLLTKAVTLAPNEEAKNRLLKFAESLNKAEVVATPQGLSPARGNINASFPSLDSYFKNHAIAGPKYKGLEVKGNEIRISFADFPMDKMPPFVKDKFTNNATTEAKKESNGKPYSLVFVDYSSGTEMLRVGIK